jgi:hypothetical protein
MCHGPKLPILEGAREGSPLKGIWLKLPIAEG